MLKVIVRPVPALRRGALWAAVCLWALAPGCGGTGAGATHDAAMGEGGSASGGTTGTGGRSGSSSGGTTGAGGRGGSASGGTSGGSSTGGTFATGGTPGAGGVAGQSSGSGGRGTGGVIGTGGATNVGGTAGRAATGSGGSSGAAGARGTGGTAGAQGSGGMTGGGGGGSPFGCKFAWGEPSPATYSWLQWVTNWMGQSIQADGTVTSCETCSWLSQLSSTNLIPAYYAYVIGFYGHVNGLPDGNQSSGPNLTTGGGALILGAANAGCPAGQICDQNKIVQAYAYYAKQSHAVWPTKPLIWLLEGDYVQYAASSQSKPLTYDQLGKLAALITTAIKTNMPNAIVAMDQSSWNADDVTNSFWAAMKQANLDLVWTTGVGNNNGFLATGTNASSYNGKTATYAYLHQLTGLKILVDESAGLSQQSDTWSNQPASTINARIAEGVIGINVSGPPSNYQSNVTALASQLNSTCP